jgi:hypothetical protein
MQRLSGHGGDSYASSIESNELVPFGMMIQAPFPRWRETDAMAPKETGAIS